MNKSTAIINGLNEHYFLNFYLGIQYLTISQKFYQMSMKNTANYIKTLAEDKLTIHKDKIFNYLINQNININGQVEQITNYNFDNPKQAIKFILEQEENVRISLNKLSQESLNENDHETFHFLTWFINDGTKDYSEVKSIYNLFSLTDDLLSIDQSVKELIEE